MAGTLTSTLIVRLLDKASGPAKNVSSAILGIEKAAKGVGGGSALQRLDSAIARNNARLDEVRGKMVDAVGGVLALRGAYSSTIAPAVKFESAIADIGKVSNFDDAGLASYAKQLRKIAAGEIPMAVDQLAQLSAEAAAAGVDDKDLLDFTRMTAKAAVAWGMTGAAAGENLAKIKSQLQLTTAQTGLFSDAINYLSDQTAASAGDLVDYAKRVSAQGEFFGYSKEQTLAFGSAMIGAGAESDVAATSFRNMGKALTRGSSATKAQLGAWKRLGMDSRKVARAMQKDAVGTTLKVVDALGKLPEHIQASTLSDLFGDEARALAPLLANTKILRDNLGYVADEQNYANSVGKEFAKRAETSEYAIQRFKNQLNEVGLAIGGALLPGLREALATIGPLALKFSEFAEANPDLVKNVTLATGSLIALRIAMIGAQWGALMARGGLLAVARPIVAIGTWGKTAATNAIGLQAALAAMSAKHYTGWQKAGTAIGAIVRAVPGMGLASSGVTAMATALGAITFPMVAGIAAVAAAGALLYRYWDRVSSIFQGVGRALREQLQPAIDAVRPVLDAFSPIGDVIASAWGKAKTAIADFGTWIGSFFSREVLSDEQKAAWENYGHDLVTGLIDGVRSSFQGLADFLATVTIPPPNFDTVVAVFNTLRGAIEAAVDAIVGAVSRAKEAIAGLGATRVGIGHAGSNPLRPIMSGDAAAALAGTGAARIDGARARGGPVRRGGSYLVGEHGPELFNPSSSGSIIPTPETIGMMRAGGETTSGGRATAGGSLSNASVTVHVHGVTDPRKVADRVIWEIEQRIAFDLRGAHSDD